MLYPCPNVSGGILYPYPRDVLLSAKWVQISTQRTNVRGQQYTYYVLLRNTYSSSNPEALQRSATTIVVEKNSSYAIYLRKRTRFQVFAHYLQNLNPEWRSFATGKPGENVKIKTQLTFPTYCSVWDNIKLAQKRAKIDQN